MNENMQIPMQPMPVQYTICRADTATALEKLVNEKLEQGFTLHGATFTEHDYFIQPLVRLELKPLVFGTDAPVRPEKPPIVHDVTGRSPLHG